MGADQRFTTAAASFAYDLTGLLVFVLAFGNASSPLHLFAAILLEGAALLVFDNRLMQRKLGHRYPWLFLGAGFPVYAIGLLALARHQPVLTAIFVSTTIATRILLIRRP